MATKIEASGYPSNVNSESEKLQYVKDYLIKENIILDPERIEDNPTMRLVGKTFVNCLWGRFGLNLDKRKTVILQDEREFHKIMNDDSLVVTYFDALRDDRVLVQYESKKAYVESNPKGNVIIAAFVAMYGRLALYEELHKLDDRVLYLDTDSLLYTVREGEYEPALSNQMGGWTDEIESKYPGQGVFIEEFVASGPKSYGYRLSNGKTVLKVKGITQINANKDELSYESIRDVVLALRDPTFLNDSDVHRTLRVSNPLNFVRSTRDLTISNRPNSKVLGFMYDKRMNSNNSFITYPYGYVHTNIE